MARTFVMDSYEGGALQDIAHFDDDGVTFESKQTNEQSILERNDALRNYRGADIAKGDGRLHHVASIPQVIWERWQKEHPELRGADKQARDRKLAMLINDRDFARVRTSEASKF